jgi:hypothetical protein
MNIWTGITLLTATVFVISCGHMGHDMAGADDNPIGTWTSEVTAQEGMGGHTMSTTTKTVVTIEQNRFKISAETKSSGMGSDVTMPLYERTGNWTMHGDTIRFDPDTCKAYDIISDSMKMSGTCKSGMMWGMIMHNGLMSLHNMSMMEGDTAAISCTRK